MGKVISIKKHKRRSVKKKELERAEARRLVGTLWETVDPDGSFRRSERCREMGELLDRWEPR